MVMIEIGRVIDINNGKATIKIERHSLCSKCTNNCQLAGSNHERKELEVKLDNVVAARKGQLVKLEIEEKSLVLSSIIVYIIPLIGLILGYFAGTGIAPDTVSEYREYFGIAGSLVLLLISFLCVRYLDRVIGRKGKFQPRLVEIVDESSWENGGE